MSSYQWIKLYDEILDDPKMGRLSDGAYRFCINLFLMAGRQELRDGSLPNFEDLAWHLRLSDEKLDSYWQELERAEIVSIIDGKPFVNCFEKRQSATTGAERMKQYRARKKKQEFQEKPSNETPKVTEESPDSDEPVTERNTDIDKDKENIYIGANAPASDNQINPIVTALSQISKTTLWAKTEKEFDDAALIVFKAGATPQKIIDFGKVWGKHGYYSGKPALTSVVNEFPRWISGEFPQKEKPKIERGVDEFNFVMGIAESGEFSRLTGDVRQVVSSMGTSRFRNVNSKFGLNELRKEFYAKLEGLRNATEPTATPA